MKIFLIKMRQGVKLRSFNLDSSLSKTNQDHFVSGAY